MINARPQIEFPEYPCPECGWYEIWKIVKCRNQGGTVQYLFMCSACRYRTQHFIKHRLIKLAGLEPEEIQPKYPRHKCQVCGADGAENHHWAPTALFGQEADLWPQSFLCRTCHQKWHKIVTPLL